MIIVLNLKKPKYADLKTDVAAIRKAMERNVTSRPQGIGGNGLPFILDSLRDEFHGDLDIWSGSCHLRFSGGSDKIVKDGTKILGTVIALSMKI